MNSRNKTLRTIDIKWALYCVSGNSRCALSTLHLMMDSKWTWFVCWHNQVGWQWKDCEFSFQENQANFFHLAAKSFHWKLLQFRQQKKFNKKIRINHDISYKVTDSIPKKRLNSDNFIMQCRWFMGISVLLNFSN